MLDIIRSLLVKYIDDIDSGNTNLDFEKQCKILKLLGNIDDNEEMSKTNAADYIGVSRATFDNYVRDGFIPKGYKVEGFKELRWYKSDLDLYLIKNETTFKKNSSQK